MSRRLITVGLPVLAVAIVAAVATLVAATSESKIPMVGADAPPLTGTDLDGDPLDLADLRGDIVLVNMWASWCAPCEEEIPVLVEAHERYGADSVRVLGVATQDREAAVRSAASRWGADAYPNILDEGGRLAVEWGVVGLPETYVIDRDGTIAHRHFGPVTADWVEETVEPMVGR